MLSGTGATTVTFSASPQSAVYSSSIVVTDSWPNPNDGGPNVRTFDTVSALVAPALANVGSNSATAEVVGISEILSLASVSARIVGYDATGDHNDFEHAMSEIKLTVTNIVAGVGFTINAYSERKLDGEFKVRYVWGNAV